MSNNFTFLKSVDKNLFEIICDAEKLYRDEYFEQCIGQIRRFAESVCKKTLGEKYSHLSTFDEMLATLKDKAKGFEQEKEFIDDLYYLKQQGNLTLHSTKVKQDGLIALECLKRAFEVALNYSVYVKNQSNQLLNLHYDVELLVTGQKNKSLATRYNSKKNSLKEYKTDAKSELKRQVKKQPKKIMKKQHKSTKQILSDFFSNLFWGAFALAIIVIGILCR